MPLICSLFINYILCKIHYYMFILTSIKTVFMKLYELSHHILCFVHDNENLFYYFWAIYYNCLCLVNKEYIISFQLGVWIEFELPWKFVWYFNTKMMDVNSYNIWCLDSNIQFKFGSTLLSVPFRNLTSFVHL